MNLQRIIQDTLWAPLSPQTTPIGIKARRSHTASNTKLDENKDSIGHNVIM